MTTAKTMYLCNECNVCSSGRPQRLNWGHECWAYTDAGKRIEACESYIVELPVFDEAVLAEKERGEK